MRLNLYILFVALLKMAESNQTFFKCGPHNCSLGDQEVCVEKIMETAANVSQFCEKDVFWNDCTDLECK